MKKTKLYNGVFDVTRATQSDLNDLAEAIEEYLIAFTEVMIFPEGMSKKEKDMIDESITRVRKLIKKLRNGDKSVFKDADEWNSLE